MQTGPLNTAQAVAGDAIAEPLAAGQLAAGQLVAAQPATGQAGTGEAVTAAGPRWDPRPRVRRWAVPLLGPVAWPTAIYLASRLVLLIVAMTVAAADHRPLSQDVFLFDGHWYVRLAEHGYPTSPLHAKSTLGFFPLYPLVLRGLAWLLDMPVPAAALFTSVTGGLVAAILVQRLAAGWWGDQTARWATLVFCLFPGSVVFSMAYSECLTIPLALGCLLALRSRRWWAAGLIAGLATAVEPAALVLIPLCLAAAVAHLRRHGWRDPLARRSILAPLLAPLGIGALAVFLWGWTGTPFAAYLAQHYGWHQQSEPLALAALPLARRLISHQWELLSRLFAWNIWNGLLGGVFLVFSIRALVRIRTEITAGAIALPVGIAALTLWSVLTPPNARMTLIAFPAVIVWARLLSGRRLAVFLGVEALALLGMSALTFSGHMLP